jgi:hypothetical protein
MISYIYKITNRINNKSYIGKTRRGIEERFKEHIADSKRERCEKRPLYSAFRKYGVENFDIELVEEVDDNELSDREIYWIEYYDTYHNGYNATKGGDGKAYVDEDKIEELYKQYRNATKVAEIMGIHPNTAQRSLIKKGYDLSFYARPTPSKDSFHQEFHFAMKGRDGVLIKVFSNIDNATDYVKNELHVKSKEADVRRHILQTCRHERETAYGFVWEFKMVE